MRSSSGTLLVLVTTCWLAAQSAPPSPKKAAPPKKPLAITAPEPDPQPLPKPDSPPPPDEKLTFGIEWRLIRAGMATIESRKQQTVLRLESAGFVSSLFKIQDLYTMNYDESLCALNSVMDAMEGKRHLETKVTYDRSQNHAFFVERDLLKNAVIRETGTDIPNCVVDVLGGLLKLRGMNLDAGQSIRIATSDGRRTANVKIEAQERENIKTPLGAFKTIRYEAEVLNDVIYARKGRVFVWLNDDSRRVPVQIRVRMNFPVGTVTLQLEKQERF